MKYHTNLIFTIILIAQVNTTLSKSAITYKTVGSRFGDSVINYVKSKYFSHKYSLPFYYKPFKYSNLLTMHHLEKKFNTLAQKADQRIVLINNEQQLKYNNDDTLYLSHFYSKTDDLYQYATEHPSFAAEIKKMLTPIAPSQFTMPANIITVAIHIRKGGGYDKPLASEQYYNINYASLNINTLETKPQKTYADYIWPTKFPPEQYYVDQLKTLSSLLNDVPLYVYIFTDEQNTYALVERIKKAVDKDNIIFDHRKTNNRHDLNVVEDFYAISKFDYLIRSSSLYTQAAELLGNHKCIFYPQKTGWIKNKLIVYEVSIKMPDHNKQLVTFSLKSEKNIQHSN